MVRTLFAIWNPGKWIGKIRDFNTIFLPFLRNLIKLFILLINFDTSAAIQTCTFEPIQIIIGFISNSGVLNLVGVWLQVSPIVPIVTRSGAAVPHDAFSGARRGFG